VSLRSLPVSLPVFFVGLALAGCQAPPSAITSDLTPHVAVPAPVVQTNAGSEQTLDTDVAPAPPLSPAPILEVKSRVAKVRTPDDAHLPKWVPVRGRLTVVDSSDLAENLGLVPQGATKKTDGRISVAEKLEEERRARKAGDPIVQGATWAFSVKPHVTRRR
jgi:hypothetical protein